MLKFSAIVAVAFLPLLVSGCAETQAEPEHGHEHSHAHGASPTFQGRVSRVRRQYLWTLKAAAGDDAKHFQHELEHFLEFAESLPVLAAETDLGKSDWDRVNAASQTLTAEGMRIGKSKAEPSDAEKANVDAAFQTLNEIVGKLPTR